MVGPPSTAQDLVRCDRFYGSVTLPLRAEVFGMVGPPPEIRALRGLPGTKAKIVGSLPVFSIHGGSDETRCIRYHSHPHACSLGWFYGLGQLAQSQGKQKKDFVVYPATQTQSGYQIR